MSGTYLIQLEGGKPIVGLCEPENEENWLVSDVTLMETNVNALKNTS